jgi:predicted CXXCH cytochrome family protein
MKGDFHVPYLEGSCTACHEPHGGGAEHHLKDGESGFCSTCHADKVAQEGGVSPRHPAMEAAACLDCHTGHATTRPALLKQAPGKLCQDCHDKEDYPVPHAPYQVSTCEGCHLNHSNNPALLPAPVNLTCTTCHTEIAKAAGSEHPHPPVREGSCTDCHLPHGGDHPKLLQDEARALCENCHDPEELLWTGVADSLRPLASGERTPHAPFADGECGRCHDPHGSPNARLTRRPGAELCYGCHQEEKLRFAEGKVHDPVRKGACEHCHAPHAGSSGKILAMPEPALCLQCHRVGDPKLGAAHEGFVATKTKCTSCHAPHSSTDEHLLDPFPHPPFAEGSCEACHAEGEPPSKANARRQACVECHDDKAEGTGHQKVAGVDCVDCHRPHAAGNPELLVASADRLCTKCHADRGGPAEAGETVHPPAARGECLRCHDVHEPAARPLLVQKPPELCGSCHEDIRAREKHPTQHPPFARGQCDGCHRTHVAKEAHLLKRPEGQLCRTCHSFKSEKMAKAHHRVPLEGRACTTCHDPHSTAEKVSALLLPEKHAPVAEGACRDCHDSLAKGRSVDRLCQTCHDDKDPSRIHPGEKGRDHPEAKHCTSCHSPHAGYGSLLVRSTDEATCTRCHDRREFSGEKRHGALESGCTACHDPHEDNFASFEGQGTMELCAQCHEQSAQHTHPVGKGTVDPRTGKMLTCTSCHRPHSSDHDYLLAFDYRRDLCIPCQAGGTMRAR